MGIIASACLTGFHAIYKALSCLLSHGFDAGLAKLWLVLLILATAFAPTAAGLGKRKWCLGGCWVPGVVDLYLCYNCRPFMDGEAHFYKSPLTPCYQLLRANYLQGSIRQGLSLVE